MIISPPILKPQTTQQSDEAWVDSIMSSKSAADGGFPITANLAWHGGFHLENTDNSATGNSVRAIADGVVVYSRASSGLPANVNEPLAYSGPTDDGCVVIQHTTEIGDQVSVTYYSVYMHMRKEVSFEANIRKGKKVYRKQEIGLIGLIKKKNMIHMEIVCDQENLEKLVGRNTPELDLSKDGRTSVVYGDIHFYLPKGTKFHASKETTSAATYSNEALFVTLHFEKGEAYLSTRREMTAGSGTYQVIAEAALVKVVKPQNGNGSVKYYQYEYDLYTFATKFATPTVSASAVYELLRFGRVLDTNDEPSDIKEVEHWHEVNYGGGTGYVNLNVPEIKKFSDGDLPHWMGWRLIDDDPTQDSQCNSPILLKWLDTDGNSKNTHAELTAALNDKKVQSNLSKTICNFPTEWTKSLIDTQYSWLSSPSDALPEPLTIEDYTKFKAHVTALSFWEEMQAPVEGALPATKHWHFHPREFIKHFRKCGWLSTDELERIYPNNIYPITILATVGKTPSIIREKYRVSINKITEKNFINTATRKSHFYGQGAVESMFLVSMIEGAASFTVNPNHASFQSEANGYYNPSSGGYLDYLNGRLGNVEPGDGPKFRGRGMKQLTGRENYSKYWVFRGWLNPVEYKVINGTFAHPWWNPARPNLAPKITDPQRLSISSYNAVDAGGWYWGTGSSSNHFKNINNNIKENDVSLALIRRVTFAINGGYNGLNERISHTQRISKILLD